VPSTAVTTSPNITDPAVAVAATPAAAPAWNTACSTPAGNRDLACDNATAVTGSDSTITGLNEASNGHNRPITLAYP